MSFKSIFLLCHNLSFAHVKAGCKFPKLCKSMVQKVSEYDQEMQTNPQHRKEEPHNIYSNNTFVIQ